MKNSKTCLVLRTAQKKVLLDFIRDYGGYYNEVFLMEFSDKSIAKGISGIKEVFFVGGGKIPQGGYKWARDFLKTQYDDVIYLVNKGKEAYYENVYNFIKNGLGRKNCLVYIEGKGMFKSGILYRSYLAFYKLSWFILKCIKKIKNEFINCFSYVFYYLDLKIRGLFPQKNYYRKADNKKVLLIVNRFPPLFHGGNVRWVKFIKYLSGRFSFFVLTSDVKRQNSDNQYDLLNEISEKCSIKRIFYKDVEYKKVCGLIPIIDEYHIWSLKAYQEAERIVKFNKISTVIVSAPLYSPLLIGYYLKIRFGIKFIVDLRDEWVLSDLPSFQRLKTSYNAKWEEKILKTADYVFFTTYSQAKKYIERYNFLKDKVRIITNGCDLAESFDIKSNTLEKKDSIFIDYFGTLNDDRITNAVIGAFNKMKLFFEYGNRVYIRFFGRVCAEKQYSLIDGETINYCGAVDRKKMLFKMNKESDILLTIASSFSSAYIAGKSFEMLLSGKPIIAIVPDGEAKSLFEKFEGVFIANPDREGEIIQAFTDAMNFYSVKRYCDRRNALKQYFHRNIAESFENLLV